MAISCEGVIDYKIIPESCRKLDFIEFVNHLPTEKVVGKTLVMDNVSFHHSREVVEATVSKGCKLLYIPPYSPRYNAIEYAFSSIKRSYRAICSDADILLADPNDYQGAIILSIELCNDFKRIFRRIKKTVCSWTKGTRFVRYDE